MSELYRPIVELPHPERDGRRLAVSDIHGCALTFRALLEKVRLTKDDHLYLLGDLINRGPRSKETVDLILELIAEGFHIHTLRGNHEETLLHIANTGKLELPLLLRTRHSMDLLNKKGEVRKRFLRFFQSLPYCFDLGDFYLVHAGFNLSAADPMQDRHAMVWQRPFLMRDGLLNGRRVVFGHQPRPINKIVKAMASGRAGICIDNGCTHAYMGNEFGALVCLDLDSGDVFRKRNIDTKK